MEGFTYVDIFATKGMEYIFVIFFLMLFVFFAYLTFRPKGTSAHAGRELRSGLSAWFRVPEFLYYHQGHTWALPEGEKIAKIGLDDFAQRLVGKIDVIEVPWKGSEILQGERAWRLRVQDREIDMLAPLDGEVVDVNEEVLKDPSKILEDPYGKGWILRVYSPNLRANLKNLITGRLARRWMEMVWENLFSRMNYQLGVLLQDGGIPLEGMARGIDRERWDELVKEFFLTREA